MNVLPRDYNGDIDWLEIIMLSFFVALFGSIAFFVIAFAKMMWTSLDDKPYGYIERDQPCEKYTLVEYREGKVPYECATKAEELQIRIK